MRSKPISYTTNLWILPLLMALFSVSLRAQQPGKDSWDNLNRLQAGQKVQVVQMDFKSREGRFLGFSEEAITLRVKKKSVAVPREEVLRVSLRGKRKRGLSALIAAGLGAGLGAVAGVASCGGRGIHPCEGEPGLFAAGGTRIGAGAGAGVGAAVPFIRSHQTIYRVKRKKPAKVRYRTITPKPASKETSAPEKKEEER